jgi:hypothetical protein
VLETSEKADASANLIEMKSNDSRLAPRTAPMILSKPQRGQMLRGTPAQQLRRPLSVIW